MYKVKRNILNFMFGFLIFQMIWKVVTPHNPGMKKAVPHGTAFTLYCVFTIKG